jgi:hypothetical protein
MYSYSVGGLTLACATPVAGLGQTSKRLPTGADIALSVEQVPCPDPDRIEELLA